MPPQARVSDISQVQAPGDAHGCPACPHPALGPAIAGSPDVMVNGLPALRDGDPGIHMVCCGPNTWKAVAGSGTVMFNGKPAHRASKDMQQHCGGIGKISKASLNVETGD